MSIKRIVLQYDTASSVTFSEFLSAVDEYVRTKGTVRFQRLQPIYAKNADGAEVFAGSIRGSDSPMTIPENRTKVPAFKASLRETAIRLWNDADATVIKRFEASAAEEDREREGAEGTSRMWLYVFRLELVYPSFTDPFITSGRIAVVRLSGIRKRPGLKAKEHPADFDDLKRLSPKLYEWLPRVGLPAEDDYVKAFFGALPELTKPEAKDDHEVEVQDCWKEQSGPYYSERDGTW